MTIQDVFLVIAMGASYFIIGLLGYLFGFESGYTSGKGSL